MTIIETFAVPTTRTAIIDTAHPETRAMIRHGSPRTTVAIAASWPMNQRVPIPKLSRVQGALASRTNAARRLKPHKITLIRAVAALPDGQRLPARTTPKPFYP